MCDDRPVTAQPDAATAAPDLQVEPSLGESRWPPALALVLFMAINIALKVWLPHEGAIRAPWVVPAVETVLLVTLLLGPATLVEHRRWLRPVSVALVVVLVIAALWSTAFLVKDMIEGTGVTQSPTELLASGAVVWLGNNVAFALLYWLMDSGGPSLRARRPDREPIDFAFTQQMSPELVPGGGGRCSSTISTSVSRMRRRSAPRTSCRSRSGRSTRCSCSRRVALALFGLVVARAINAFA